MKNKLLALTALILASCTPAYADLGDVQKYITETYRVPRHEADHIIQATIEQAKTHNLNPSVVLGIMETESNFNKNVVSSKVHVDLCKSCRCIVQKFVLFCPKTAAIFIRQTTTLLLEACYSKNW